MSTARQEWKVGLFVLLGLTLLGILMVQFSKSWTGFKPTYELKLKALNVGGLKPQSSVLMAGIVVGQVLSTDLSPDGKSVMIRVRIFKRYPIRRDAHFLIEQSGFLGDQFVSIGPQENKEPPEPLLKDGDEVICQEPFNLQEAARSAIGLIHRLDGTVQTINATVERVDRLLLSENTLTNAKHTLDNLQAVSTQAKLTLTDLDELIRSNRAGIVVTVTNLAQFSERLNQSGAEVQTLLANNRSNITSLIAHTESASSQVDGLFKDLQAGRGLAGSLLKNEPLDGEFKQLVNQLTLLSSNLNKFGLFYKPKPVRTNPAAFLYPGKDPRR